VDHVRVTPDPGPSRLEDPAFLAYVDGLVRRYEQPRFITGDPVSIPHGFDDPRDREIVGLFAALLAWGRRSTILASMEALCERMRWRPHAFVRDFRPGRDAARLDGFRHRTFGPADAVGLVLALSAALERHGSIERAFAAGLPAGAADVGPGLDAFSAMLTSVVPDVSHRLRRHLARPSTGSACKRLNMYLRWMVRPGPVDLGIWTSVSPRQLVLPLDVHAGRQARALGMVSRRADDWKAASELTRNCRGLFPDDPARCDFAFFGPGASGDELDPRFTVRETGPD
jgi:uncharacterized protein (TIGR02757 family)